MDFYNTRNKLVDNLRNLITSFDCYRLMSFVPMSSDECYFCIINDDECDKCEYGKKYGKCKSGNGSPWKHIYNSISEIAVIYDSVDMYCVDELEMEKIYNTIIPQISECKTVNGVMTLKRELISQCFEEIEKCFREYDDVEISEKLLKLVEYVDENYWVTEIKDLPNVIVTVGDVKNSSIYNELIDMGYDDCFILADIKPLTYKSGQKIKIYGEDDIYIIAECEYNKYCLININDGNRWDDAVRIEDGIITKEILVEQLLGGEHNFEIIE